MNSFNVIILWLSNIKSLWLLLSYYSVESAENLALFLIAINIYPNLYKKIRLRINLWINELGLLLPEETAIEELWYCLVHFIYVFNILLKGISLPK